MSSLTKEKLITALRKLSEFMADSAPELEQVMFAAKHQNAWFTTEEVKKAIHSLSEMLSHADLIKWFDDIEINHSPKKVGLILAGNIPLVGFHDVLCVLATGNIALIKMSSSDERLLPFLLNQLVSYEPALKPNIQYTDRLAAFDAIIATGSNNSSRYFDYYFGKVPHIIRKNRNSVTILTGNESTAELEALGKDIFDFFGLGCRNVSKIYVPQCYDFHQFFQAIEKFQPIIHHFKYNNNYDYNKSIYLVNGVPHLDNGFLLVKEDETFASPLAVLFYEKYDQLDEVTAKLQAADQQIQCIVGPAFSKDRGKISFGDSQQPRLWDYADHVNTIDFLQGL